MTFSCCSALHASMLSCLRSLKIFSGVFDSDADGDDYDDGDDGDHPC